MIGFACPRCGKRFRVTPELAGRMIRCPACHIRIKVPEIKPSPAAPQQVAAQHAKATPHADPTARAPAKAPPAKTPVRQPVKPVQSPPKAPPPAPVEKRTATAPAEEDDPLAALAALAQEASAAAAKPPASDESVEQTPPQAATPTQRRGRRRVRGIAVEPGDAAAKGDAAPLARRRRTPPAATPAQARAVTAGDEATDGPIVSGFAVLALTAGLFAFIPGLTLPAIVFGIIALVHVRRSPRFKGTVMAIVGIGLGVVMPIVTLVAFNMGAFAYMGLEPGKAAADLVAVPEQPDPRDDAEKLASIAEVMRKFAAENAGEYPGHVAELMLEGQLSPAVFASNSAPDFRPPRSRPRYDRLPPYRFGDFVFTYPTTDGLKLPDNAVLAFSRYTSAAETRGVLYADGSTALLTPERFGELVEQQNELRREPWHLPPIDLRALAVR